MALFFHCPAKGKIQQASVSRLCPFSLGNRERITMKVLHFKKIYLFVCFWLHLRCSVGFSLTVACGLSSLRPKGPVASRYTTSPWLRQ